MNDTGVPQKPSRRPAVAPPQFGDVIAWAAWLYYVDEMTQAEIALALGVSRASIANFLHEARRTGVVKIRIDPGIVARTELSRALARHFGLASATVVPSLDDRSVDTRIGTAGAKVLAAMLETGDTVGVAWGRTILAAARAAEGADIEGLTIVQVSGSASSTADFSPELCTTLLANQLGARCANLHAPAVLSSRTLRDQLLAEPALQRQFALIRSVNKIVFGVGELGPGSTFAESGMLAGETLDELRALNGAEAVVIGRLIDREGVPVLSAIDDTIVGIALEDVRKVPVRLCLAGGRQKIRAVRAALKGGLVTHLVTDAETAARLIDSD